MQADLITLFSRVFVPAGHGTVDQKSLVAFNHEVGTLGYTLGADVMHALSTQAPVQFMETRKTLLGHLTTISGVSARHAVLFNSFPYETPDQWDYLVRRLVGYLQTDLLVVPANGQTLSCGHVIDPALFDLKEFGACPICQYQVEELNSPETVRHQFQSITPLKILNLADEAFLLAKGDALLTRNSSLSATEKALLRKIGEAIPPLNRPATVFRENLPFVYTLFNDVPYVATLLAGATDVLRIACYLSNPEADLSLKTPTKFKLSTHHKRALLTLLEGIDDVHAIAEDMVRWRERWLRLGEVINPGTDQNMRRFPMTSLAFRLLRENPGGIDTFNQRVESGLRFAACGHEAGAKTQTSLLGTLSTRPGEFARRLDVLLRTLPDPMGVVREFGEVMEKVPSKLLLELLKYFEHRRTSVGDRVFFPKGNVNKVQIIPDCRPSLPTEALTRLEYFIESELVRRHTALPPMGAVYLDPALRNYVLPFNKRGDSATAAPMAKGSKYPVNPDMSVVRLFVHWSKSRDVDLSLIMYDERFDMIDHIAFTNTKTVGAVHSGDVQNGWNGASEFIDFDIAKFRERGVRYVATSVISFSGNTFDQFPCFVGYMERDSLKSGARFEPESVALKFDLNAPNTSHMPLIFDLVNMQVIFVDMASARNNYGVARDQNKKFVTIMKAMLELNLRKPTAYDLLEMNIRARGHAVSEIEEAELVFKAGEVDLDSLATDYLV